MAGLDLASTTIPSWLERPDWKTELEDAWLSTVHAERWKYTKAERVLGLIEGSEWKFADGERADFDISPVDSPEAYLALARSDGVRVVDAAGSRSLPHDAPTFVRVADNVTAEISEEFAATGKQIQLLWIVLGRGSRLTHTRHSYTNETEQWQYLNVIQGQDSSYTLHNHCLGAQLRRQDIQIRMQGDGAELSLMSAAYVAEKLHLDQQITVEHIGRNTSSRQKIHNIGADGATVTCNGRIHIHEGAVNTDADLSNRNLALGGNAAINAKPELEIYSDDVKCSHGATVGQLSDEQVFYCTSRGIDPREARMLLSRGFLLEGVAGPGSDEAVEALTAALA